MELPFWGPLLVAIIVASSLLAVAYVWRIVESLYFSEPSSEPAVVREAPRALLLAAWLVAALNIYFGLVPAVPVELATSAAESLMGHTR